MPWYLNGLLNSTHPLLEDGDALVFKWFAKLHNLRVMPRYERFQLPK